MVITVNPQFPVMWQVETALGAAERQIERLRAREAAHSAALAESRRTLRAARDDSTSSAMSEDGVGVAETGAARVVLAAVQYGPVQAFLWCVLRLCCLAMQRPRHPDPACCCSPGSMAEGQVRCRSAVHSIPRSVHVIPTRAASDIAGLQRLTAAMR